MNFHGGQLKREGMVDFSVNIPMIPFEKSFKALLIKSIDQLDKYPEIDGATARESVATFLEIEPSQVVLGNGATDLIYLICKASKFEKAAILQPTFTEYERALTQEGTQIHHIASHEGISTFDIEADEIASKVNFSQSEALFICNPNNPTGQLLTPSYLEEILKKVKNPNFVLVLDESFIDFKVHPDHHGLMRKLIERYRIVIIRSMTKTYRVPGLRIGYLFGTKDVVKIIANYTEPWTLNHMALMSIPYFLSQYNFVTSLQQWCECEANYMNKELNKISQIKCFNNEANFILIKVDEEKSLGFYEKMLNKGIHLRKCTDFRGLNHQYFRLAIMDHENNTNILRKLKEALND
ncbi:pyridoxal phosphate-dependent aminotransferase [Fusibacter bizertensis]